MQSSTEPDTQHPPVCCLPCPFPSPLVCLCQGFDITLFLAFSLLRQRRGRCHLAAPGWGFSLQSSFNKGFILRLPAQQMFLFVLVYVDFNSAPNVPFITSSGSTSRPLCCSRQSLGGSELCYLQISAVRLKELAKTFSCKLFSQDSTGFSQCSRVSALLALAGIEASCWEQPSCPFKAQLFSSHGQQHQAATRCRFPFPSPLDKNPSL